MTKDMELPHETSPEEDNTISSASLCLSPAGTRDAPLCSSTPYTRALTNGHDSLDSRARSDSDVINGNVTVNVIHESTNSMDVLSGGESDAGDTLSRRNNNSISSCLLGTLKESISELPQRRDNCDITYFVAKELLMTERTYKRDLELVTVTWSQRVSTLKGSGAEIVSTLARASFALEPLALSAGALLARLERTLHRAHPAPTPETESEEPEYKKIADILYDYLSSTAEAYTTYIERAATLVGLVESVRRRNSLAGQQCAEFDGTSPLPLTCLLLRPLHRTLHLERLAGELCSNGVSPGARALALAQDVARAARDQLRHIENHCALCHMQRDIVGYDKLLVADREFIRMGCLYKHSTRGLQQRMLFLFNDVLIISSKSGSSQFRAHAVLPLHTLEVKSSELPHSFSLLGSNVDILLSASNEHEFYVWRRAVELAAAAARDAALTVDTELTPYEQEIEGAGGGGGGGLSSASGLCLSHVCWHRVTSLHRRHLHLAMRTQLSGYLLRKFKKSPGWQKLWVVFAAFALFFYKNWRDETPLASLPLLGYSVGLPSTDDGVDKEFVFKLQFKNHVYFFRADSQYTYSRWTEVLRTAMTQEQSSEE